MRILAVDPGTEKSGVVVFDTEGGSIVWHGIPDNDALKEDILGARWHLGHHGGVLVIEEFENYGMPVGKDMRVAIFWSGKLSLAAEQCGVPTHLMPRREAKMHLCGNMRARDSNIRQAIINRYGGKQKAIGRKASPGPLYGIKSHEWAALALALTYWDREVPRIKARAAREEDR